MSTMLPLVPLAQGEGPQILAMGVSDSDVYIANNDGLAVVQVHNPTGGAIDIQLVPTLTVGGVSAGVVSLSIPAGETCWLPPMPPAVYNDDDGEAHITDTSEGSLVFNGLRF